MKIQTKLIFLEVISGLFGWTWIVASIGIVVAGVAAIFFDWSWWNVLYAFLIGGVAKWLAKGFIDNKNRVLFEHELILKGLSPEDAANEWFRRYAGEK